MRERKEGGKEEKQGKGRKEKGERRKDRQGTGRSGSNQLQGIEVG